MVWGHSSVTYCSGGGKLFPGKKHYKGVLVNVISIRRGWVGVNFPEKVLRNTGVAHKTKYEPSGHSNMVKLTTAAMALSQ